MFLEPFDVEQILFTPGCALVGDEVSAGEHCCWLVGESCSDTLRPGAFELDVIDGGDDINSNGLDTDLENEARCRKILSGQVVQRSAKIGERLEHPLGVG